MVMEGEHGRSTTVVKDWMVKEWGMVAREVGVTMVVEGER